MENYYFGLNKLIFYYFHDILVVFCNLFYKILDVNNFIFILFCFIYILLSWLGLIKAIS